MDLYLGTRKLYYKANTKNSFCVTKQLIEIILIFNNTVISLVMLLINVNYNRGLRFATVSLFNIILYQCKSCK